MPTRRPPTPTLHLARWTVTSGSQRPEPRRGRHRRRRPSLAGLGRGQRRRRRAVQGRRPGARRGPRRPPATPRLRRPRAREGPDRGRRDRPHRAAGRRGRARRRASTTARPAGTNIIAASIEAYIDALNAMLAEEHWEGAPEAAAVTGKRARAKAPVTAGAARERRAELDEESGEIDTTDWFNQ